MSRINIPNLYKLKTEKQKIVMLTAYNYIFAKLLDRTNTHMILVGDSLGMTALGHDSTIPVTMQDMCSATAAVVRGCENKFIVADMPFLSYQISVETAVANAGELMRHGAQGVKLEGAGYLPAIKAIIAAGIPVVGHLGFTPQSVHQLGGYKIQGKTDDSAAALLKDAKALQEAGVFAIVLEMVPAAVATQITEKLNLITIGIGAGNGTDGQVLVTDDLIGLYDHLSPKFVKKYAQIGKDIETAVNSFFTEIQAGIFPDEDHSY